jgi:hypothetical protein
MLPRGQATFLAAFVGLPTAEAADHNWAMHRILFLAGLVLWFASSVAGAAELRRDIEYGKVGDESLKLDASVSEDAGLSWSCGRTTVRSMP